LPYAGGFALLLTWQSWTRTRVNDPAPSGRTWKTPGERIGAYDVFIAGIASARGHVLATHDVREFGRVAGIQAEGWAAIP
jgi:tRNA(fMet)-specific endonuclease VapC